MLFVKRNYFIFSSEFYLIALNVSVSVKLLLTFQVLMRKALISTYRH